MSEVNHDIPMISKHQAEMHEMHLVHQNSNIKAVAIVLAVLLALSIIALAFTAVSMAKSMTDQYLARH